MNRFAFLDGLRGLAILLVFFNHIPSNILTGPISFPLRTFIEIPFCGGQIAVPFLFFISGFLMAYIYKQPKNYWEFLQKRYHRIFPLFITMNILMLSYRFFPNLNVVSSLLVLFSTVLICSFIYKLVINLNSRKLNVFLFFGFIFFQIIIALIYLLVVMRGTAESFSLWQTSLRELFIFLVNVTLTLPLGDYVPFLDGVYWSLVAEVLFYVLYPVLFAPIASWVSQLKRFKIKLFLIVLIPLLVGLFLIFNKVLVLSMIRINLFSFFIAGIALSFIVRQDVLAKLKLSPYFYKFSLYLFFLITIIYIIIGNYVPIPIRIWFNTSFAFLLLFVLSLGLNSNSSLSKFLNNKLLIFYGTISYSLYLSHIYIVNLAKTVYLPKNSYENLIFIFIVLAIETAVAYFIYELIEKLYFSSKLNKPKKILLPKAKSQEYTIKPKTIFVLIISGYLFFCFIAFQGRYNFLSREQRELLGAGQLVLNNVHPLESFSFKADYNNLGIIELNLAGSMSDSNSKALVILTVKENNSETVSITKIPLKQINKNKPFPFGLPVRFNSKNRNYEIRIQLVKASSNDKLVIANQPYGFSAVYSISKQELLSGPIVLFDLTRNKLITIFSDPNFFYSLLLIIPFTTYVFVLRKEYFLNN